VRIHKLSSTDAFVAFDLDDAPAAGATRLARKVLRDGAELLARSTTYAFASYGIRMGGGSAGINAETDERDAAVAAFVEEMGSVVAEGRWVTDPALGLSEADLAQLRIDDPRPSELWTDGLADTLTAQGAVAAAAAVRDGDLTGATCAFVGNGPVVDAARSAVEAAGGTLAAGNEFHAEADVVFVAGKAGMLDHEDVPNIAATVVVPLTPVPVTARAHAELTKAGTVHVPDFVSTAAPLLHAHGDDVSDPVAAVGEKVASLASHGTGLWLAAVEEAEAFLRSWRDQLPFGRPLA
jgi:glutamate dehydrogenase/leucine dehydrogenase